jgi:hypothetical protein
MKLRLFAFGMVVFWITVYVPLAVISDPYSPSFNFRAT